MIRCFFLFMSKEVSYSDNSLLNDLIKKNVDLIKDGKVKGFSVMIKNKPTLILKASKDHLEWRYRPGNKLITYTGVKNGKLIKETWGGGVVDIKSDSVILKNSEPIKDDNGKEVRGYYKEGTSEFVIDSKGNQFLFNEYVSDVGFVKSAYGVSPSNKWQEGFKRDPSYVFEIPNTVKGYGSINVITLDGVKIELSIGDFVVVDTKKGKVQSVHGIKKSWLNKTYKKM